MKLPRSVNELNFKIHAIYIAKHHLMNANEHNLGLED